MFAYSKVAISVLQVQAVSIKGMLEAPLVVEVVFVCEGEAIVWVWPFPSNSGK